jgi:hypothetical protein
MASALSPSLALVLLAVPSRLDARGARRPEERPPDLPVVDDGSVVDDDDAIGGPGLGEARLEETKQAGGFFVVGGDDDGETSVGDGVAPARSLARVQRRVPRDEEEADREDRAADEERRAPRRDREEREPRDDHDRAARAARPGLPGH